MVGSRSRWFHVGRSLRAHPGFVLDPGRYGGAAATEGDGEFTFEITSGTRLTLTESPALPRGTYNLLVVRYGVFVEVVGSYRSISMAAWWRAGQGETLAGALLTQANDLSGNSRHLVFSSGLEPTKVANDGMTLNNSPAWDFAGGKYTSVSWRISTESACLGCAREAVTGRRVWFFASGHGRLLLPRGSG